MRNTMKLKKTLFGEMEGVKCCTQGFVILRNKLLCWETISSSTPKEYHIEHVTGQKKSSKTTSKVGRRSDRGESAKSCKQKKKEGVGSLFFFSLSSRRTPHPNAWNRLRERQL